MFEAITLADRPRDAHDDCETLQAMLDDLDCYVAPCGKEGFDEIKAGGSTANDPAPRGLTRAPDGPRRCGK